MVFLLLSFASPEDRDKFEYLYSKYKNLLLKKAWDILRDYMLAEDAVSEAYLRIYKNLHKIEDPDANRSIAFIVTITRNAALTMLKKADTVVEYDDAASADYDLEASVVDGLSAERVYTILQELNQETRDIFILKFAYDMSHREIAEATGLTENNVTVRLHRARKRISEIIKKEEPGYES